MPREVVSFQQLLEVEWHSDWVEFHMLGWVEHSIEALVSEVLDLAGMNVPMNDVPLVESLEPSRNSLDNIKNFIFSKLFLAVILPCYMALYLLHVSLVFGNVRRHFGLLRPYVRVISQCRLVDGGLAFDEDQLVGNIPPVEDHH